MALSITVRFGIGATIRIGREIQSLPYAGFFLRDPSIKQCKGNLGETISSFYYLVS